MRRPLEGAWAKLGRSQEHVRSLLEESDAYFASEPYTLEGSFDPITSEWVVRIRVKVEIPLRWSTIIGDALHNLRSALDYLVYDLARLSTGKKRPRGTQFPIIATNAADYRTKGLPRVRALDPRHRRVVRLLQPYQHNDPDEHPLTLLNRLSNADKHRLLHPTIGYLGGASYRFEMHEGVTGIRSIAPIFGPLEDGAEVVRVVIDADAPNPDMRVGGDFAFVLAFREIDTSVLGLLFEIGFDVASILNWFTPVFGPVKRA